MALADFIKKAKSRIESLRTGTSQFIRGVFEKPLIERIGEKAREKTLPRILPTLKEEVKGTALKAVTPKFLEPAVDIRTQRKIAALPREISVEEAPLEAAKDVSKAVVRTFPGQLARFTARLGLEATPETQRARAEGRPEPAFIPTPRQEEFVGEGPITPLGSGPIARRSREFLERLGVGEEKAALGGIIPSVVVGSLLESPFFVVGKGAKIAKEVIEEAVQKLGKEVTERLAKEGGEKALVKAIQETVEKTVEKVAPKTISESAEQVGKEVLQESKKFQSSVAEGFDPVGYVQTLKEQQSSARVGPVQRIGEKAKKIVQEVKSKIIDSNAPIEDVLRSAQKEYKFSVRPEFDITNAIDKTLRAPTLAGQFTKDKGLEEVILKVDNIDNLNQYLIAKQARDVAARGIETGRDLLKDEQLIKSFEDVYEPFAKEINNYSQALLDKTVEDGLISKELADELKKIYPNYVPLQRIFNEIEQVATQGAGGGVASLSQQTVIQKLKGSDREIEDPISSLLAKTNDIFLQGEKNKAAKILAGYKDLPGFENLIRELEPDELIGNKHTISFLDNGVKRIFETSKEIAEAAKNLSPQQLTILEQIAAFPVRAAKLGITGINIPFIGANIARDQMFAAITSRNTLKTSIANPSVFLKSLMEAVKHGDLYDEFIRVGAGGTSFDIARSQVGKTVKQIRSARSAKERVKFLATNPSELLKSIENIVGRSEELTRLQQFEGTRRALIQQGRTSADATIEGAKAAREDTANFIRKGQWGQVLNSVFLYLNAGIQGSRALIRSMARDPKGTSVKIGTVLFLPMAATTAWNVSDPKRAEVYKDIADFEKENNLIIIPPNPTKDEKTGKWNVIKIPLPPGVSALTIPVRKGIERMNEIDTFKISDMVKTLTRPIIPFDIDSPEGIASALTPQIIKPGLEVFTNKNFFTGIPIVPRKLEGVSPELQVKPGTSGTARIIGKALNVSPLKTEMFIRETVGGVGQQLLNASDRILAGLDVIPKDQIGGRGIITDILNRFTKALGGELERDAALEVSKVLQDQADERFRIQQEAEILFAELSELPKEEANTKAFEIQSKNPEVAEKLRVVIDDSKKGLTYDERLIKQLGVENGARAKFIFEQTKRFKTKQEKNEYLNSLSQKGIISENVDKQLRELIDRNK